MGGAWRVFGTRCSDIVLCLAQLVAPYRYPTVYLFMADIENPHLSVCC